MVHDAGCFSHSFYKVPEAVAILDAAFVQHGRQWPFWRGN